MLQAGADGVGVQEEAQNTMTRNGDSNASMSNPVAPTSPFPSVKRLRARDHRRLQGDANNFLADLTPLTAGVTGGIVFLVLVICFLYCCCGCSLCDILLLFCCYELCCGDCVEV